MLEENSNTYIIDASFLLSFLLPDEIQEPKTQELFEAFGREEVSFLSTQLLPFEVLNSIKMAVIRKRLTEQKAKILAEIFLEYSIPLEKTDYLETLQISLKEHLSFYDASYLALAQKNHFPLLTLDNKLQKLSLL